MQSGQTHIGVQRYLGYRRALQEAGIAFDPALILFQTFNREGGYRVAAQLLALDVPADALICANDEAALGALTFLREQGVHVPRQVSLIGFDDSAICQATSPTLTSVNFHSNEAGQQAVRILHALIHNQSPAPEDMTSTDVYKRQLHDAYSDTGFRWYGSNLSVSADTTALSGQDSGSCGAYDE